MLANVDLTYNWEECERNLRVYAKAMASEVQIKAQEAIVRPNTTCVTECGNLTGSSWLSSTQEQSTALLRLHRHCVQAERQRDDRVLSDFPAGLECFSKGYELAYNRMSSSDEPGSDDLRSEIKFLRQSLCSLLLQPVVKPGSFQQTGIQVVDALRGRKADLNAARAEQEEQIVREHTTNNNLDLGTSDFPMTAGHLEIQAVKEAANEVSNAVLSLKNVVEKLPSQASQDHRTALNKNLEDVSSGILQFPDRLTSLLLRRKAGLDATMKDRDAAAETLRLAERKMVAAEAKEMELIAKTEAIDRDRNLLEEKMKEAGEMLMAVEAREKLVGGRERRVESSEEEQALEELNHGANAALEDEADAAAAEAREVEYSTSPSMGFPTTAENENFPPSLESISNTQPARQHVLLGRDTALAAKEVELWHRENILAFRETNLHHRETALFAREQLLEHMKTAQVKLVQNWKAQVDTSYAGLEAEREDFEARSIALITFEDRVEKTRAKVRNLIGEARGVIGRGGEDVGEDRVGVEGLDV